MNDWKRPVSGGPGGGNRSFTGPNGSTEKVDYSRVPIGESSEDEGGDWIQKKIRGHKASRCVTPPFMPVVVIALLAEVLALISLSCIGKPRSGGVV